MQEPEESDEREQGPWLDPLPGVLTSQYIQCGKTACHCQHGQMHGPYYYRIWRVGDKVSKVYVKKAEAAQVRLQCAAYRQSFEELRVLRATRIALAARIARQIVQHRQAQNRQARKR